MSVHVKYFASLRERLGREEDLIELQGAVTVRDVWDRVADMPWPSNMLTAVNFDYVDPSAPVADGDEVAFFPPVTGG